MNGSGLPRAFRQSSCQAHGGRGRFIAPSWRDGHTHLYLYQFDEKHPLAGDATTMRVTSHRLGALGKLRAALPAVPCIPSRSSRATD